MDMELRHYHYFVALAEELHFAKAAERCGISQPALSQQIRVIETSLGASLMSRSKRHLELTEVGKVFYAQAVAVLRQAEAAQHAIAEAAQGRAGRVAIAYVASAALSGVLPGIVYQYRQSRPDIELAFHQMDMEEQLAAVAKGQCDVGFIRPPILALPDSLTLFDVLREPVLVALRTNHPCAGMATINLADLRDDPFICVHRKEGIGFYDITLTVCRNAGFVPQVEVMSTQTFMPHDVVFRTIQNNDVTSALAMVHAYNNQSPAVQMFARVARDWARDWERHKPPRAGITG